MKHILAFLFIAALAFAVLHGVVSDDHLRIALFASFMLLLCITFPRIVEPLLGDAVDFIYYASAIVVAVLLFVSRETEQRIGRVSGQIPTLIDSRQSLVARSLRLDSRVAAHRDQLGKARAAIETARTQVNTPEAKALMASERDVSLAILESPVFVRFADALRSRQRWCDQITPDLMAENAYLFAQLNLLRIDRPGSPSQRNQFEDTRHRINEAQLQANLKNIDECASVTTAAKQLESPNASFKKVLELRHYMLSSILVDRGSTDSLDVPVVIGTESQNISEIVGRIAGVRASTLDLERLQQAAKELEAAIPSDTVKARRASLLAWAVRAKINSLRADIRRIRDEPVSGSALWSGQMLIFYWPYVLIAFLALKIARKEYLFRARRRADASSLPS